MTHPLLERHSRSASPSLHDAASGRVLTYRELAQEVERITSQLSPGARELVFCYCRNDLASVQNYLASTAGGHAVFLADPATAATLQTNLIQNYRPAWVLASQPTAGASLPEGDYEPIVEGPAHYWWRRRTADSPDIHAALSLLLSTSGSTGSVKLVRLSMGNVVNNARSISQALHLNEAERPITSLPIHYSYGLSVLNSHLLAGAEITLTDEKILSSKFWDTFRARECTSLAGVPYSYQILRRLGLDQLKIPSLRHLTQAGGKLAKEQVAFFAEWAAGHDVSFWVMYGQTEATARISILPSANIQHKLGSVGLPVPGGRWWVADDDNDVLPPGAVGELMYAGPNVMLGYAARPEDLARDDERNGVLATGDLAYLDEDGFCFITGRSKRITKVMGFRINLDEVEQLVRAEYPDAAVVGCEDRIVIFSQHAAETTSANLRRRLSETLKLHFAVFVFRHVAQLPLNTNGKIDYPRLQEEL